MIVGFHVRKLAKFNIPMFTVTKLCCGEFVNNEQRAVCNTRSAVCHTRSAVWHTRSAVCHTWSAVCHTRFLLSGYIFTNYTQIKELIYNPAMIDLWYMYMLRYMTDANSHNVHVKDVHGIELFHIRLSNLIKIYSYKCDDDLSNTPWTYLCTDV